MSTKLNDLANQAEVAALYGPASATVTTSGSASASTVGDGPEFALAMIGTPSSGAGVTVAIEESDDQSAWSAISGATTGAKTAAAIVPLTFQRSKKYIRAKLTITGSTPSIPVAVAGGRQKKWW